MVLENKIDRFISKIEMGRDFFVDAANMLVQMIDEEPDVCRRIVELRRVDWLTADVLSTFEAIGRKQLAVEAMFLPQHVISRLISLPVEQQAEIATAPVRVINGAAHRRRTDCTTKPASRLTKREAHVALGPSGVRSVEEQREFVQQEKKEEAARVLGYYEITVMNGKPFLKRVEQVARAQRVRLDSRSQAVLEIVME